MNYDKQRKLYEASTMVFSKPLFNGGRNFIKYNSKSKKYHIGNTASTAHSSSAGVTVYDVTTRQLKDIARQLRNQGYTEHVNKWLKGVDTYEVISKVGL